VVLPFHVPGFAGCKPHVLLLLLVLEQRAGKAIRELLRASVAGKDALCPPPPPPQSVTPRRMRRTRLASAAPCQARASVFVLLYW
jgi:hypothetical protein